MTERQIPAEIVSPADYAGLAERLLPPAVWAFIDGGAGEEQTARDNLRAFARRRLWSRPLQNLSAGSAAITLLDTPLAAPVLLAPVGYASAVRPQADLAAARAAAAADSLQVVSCLAATPLEQLPQPGAAAPWLQLYWQGGRDATLSLIRRAEAAGYGALVLTVDSAVAGLRNRAQRAGFTPPEHSLPVNLPELAPPPPLPPGASRVFQGAMAQAPRWADLDWLCQQTALPVLVKGLLHPDDVSRAMAAGASGVVVSNHGGRALDGVPASLDCLSQARAAAGPKAVVLLDGGIRRGADVFKALALGADAVLVGRLQLCALAVAGALGAAHLLRLLREELEVTMALAGCAQISEIGSDSLVEAPCY